MKTILSAIALAAVMISGCSIKADRSECPCMMNVRVIGGCEQSVDLFCRTGEKTVTGHYVIEDNGSKECFEVARGMSSFLAMSGMRSCQVEGRYLRVPFGSEMDEMYCFREDIDTDCESVDMDAILHRQYAFLFISVNGSDSEDYPYYLKLSGNVCGFDLDSLEPLEGPFSVLTRPFLGTWCRICVPRQKDDSMTIMFYDKSMTKSDALPVEELPIGKYISSEGYDWTDEDLSDIYVKIDYVKSTIEITLVPWEIIEL